MDNYIENAYAQGAAAAMSEFGIKTASAVRALVPAAQAGAGRSATLGEKVLHALGAPGRGLRSYTDAIKARSGTIKGNKAYTEQLRHADPNAIHYTGGGMRNVDVIDAMAKATRRAQLERAGLIAAPVAGAAALGAGGYALSGD